jgi:hypothetical protein
MLVLDSDYRVQVDSSRQNFILEKLSDIQIKGTDNYKKEWIGTGFHGLSLRSVLHSYAKQKLADDVVEVETADLLISKINQLEQTIEKISKQLVFEVKSNE